VEAAGSPSPDKEIKDATVLVAPRDWAKRTGLAVLLVVGTVGLGTWLASLRGPIPVPGVLGLLGGMALFVLVLSGFGGYRRVEIGPEWITAVRAFSTTPRTIPASSVTHAETKYVSAGAGPPRQVFIIRGEGKTQIVLGRQLLRDPAKRAALQRFLAASPLGAPATGERAHPVGTQGALLEHPASARKAPRWMRVMGWVALATSALYGLVTVLRVTNVLHSTSHHRAAVPSASVTETGRPSANSPGGTGTGPDLGLPSSLALTGWQVSAPAAESLGRVQLQPGGVSAWRRDGFEDCEAVAAVPPGGSGSGAVVVVNLARFASASGAAEALAFQRRVDGQSGQVVAVPTATAASAYFVLRPTLDDLWAIHGNLVLLFVTVNGHGGAPPVSVQRTDEAKALALTLAALGHPTAA
jgi:hypothetical protein